MRHLWAAAVLALLWSLLPAAPAAAQASSGLCDERSEEQFADVSRSDYAAAYILCAKALGLARGLGDGSFAPGAELSRAQMAVFLVRLWRDVLERECPAGGEPFTDVGAGHWAALEIACLHNLGITRGVTATTYEPDSSLTGSQITRFLARMLSAHSAGFCATSDDELAGAASCLASRNIAPEIDEAESPRPASRAQMAVFLVGAWHHAAGRGQPPQPPSRPSATTLAPAALPAGACGGAITDPAMRLGADDPAEGPAWSPDCSQIVFTRHGALWLMRSDGTEPRPIAATFDGGWPSHPAWSPDGSRIAYSRASRNSEGFQVNHIYAVNADGTQKVQLTSDDDVRDYSPSWSADGDNLVFGRTSGRGRVPGGDRTDKDVYVVAIDAKGKRQTALTVRGAWEGSPVWSPEGTQIAYIAAGTVVVANPDGTNARHVVSGADTSGGLSWSPDGTRLAFTQGDHKVGAIAIVSVHGGNQRVLTDIPGRQSAPSWSPDGQLVAFTSSHITFNEFGGSYPDQVHNSSRVYIVGASGQPVPVAMDCMPLGKSRITAGFPLPEWVAPSTGVVHLAVLFMDFPNAQATHSTHQEVEFSLPYMEEYLEQASYNRLDLEFHVLHEWLRAEGNYQNYLRGSWLGLEASSLSVELARKRIDLSNADAVMTVFPSDQFTRADATGNVTVGDKLVPTFRMNIQPIRPRRAITSDGWIAAHEFVHVLGLADLYRRLGYFLGPKPGGTSILEVHFGVMGLQALVFLPDSDPRLDPQYLLPAATTTDYLSRYMEMLGWSRWQLGWILSDEMRCINERDTTVVLEPISGDRRGVLLAAIPITSTKMIVLENRRPLGRDRHSLFFNGGLLVYTVDVPLDDLPLKLAGDNGDGVIGDYPLLAAGESVTIWGYRITVLDDDETTSTVRITRLD